MAIAPLPDSISTSPLRLDELFGRNADAVRLEALLRQPQVRIVTLSGPGGVGKTSLALHVADLIGHLFAHGVLVVELDEIEDPAHVLPAIAAAAGVRANAADVRGALIDALRGRHLLLLLDNLEQVAGAAPEISALLAACRDLKVLATSRIPLRLRGERVLTLEPLATPDTSVFDEIAANDAVGLFVARASEVKPEFTLTPENAVAVAAICRVLDGLPLAIELAAARSRALSPAALLATLNNRLTVLSGGAADAPKRQRALDTTIAWSYDLLSPEMRGVFRTLGVFPGSFDAEGVAAVTGLEIHEALDHLAALVDHSLVRSSGDEAEPRFTMYETIRRFAAGRLEEAGETPGQRARLLAHVAAWTAVADGELGGERGADWLRRLDLDQPAIRQSLEFALSQSDAELPLGLAVSLWRYWEIRGLASEGRGWLARAIDFAATGDGERLTPLRARALRGSGALARNQGDLDAAERAWSEAAALFGHLGDDSGIASMRLNLANLALDRGDFASARAGYEAAASSYRALGDRAHTALALNNSGLALLQAGERDDARARFQESLTLARAVGHQRWSAMALDNLGSLAFDEGDLEAAAAAHAESLTLRRAIGDRPGEAISLQNLARVMTAGNDADQAKRYALEALEVLAEIDYPGAAAEPLALIAGAMAGAHPALAAKLLGAAEGCLPGGVEAPPAWRPTETAVRRRLSKPAAAALWAEGASMTLKELLAELDAAPAEPGARATAGRDGVEPPWLQPLSERELEVLKLIAEGAPDREIAEALFVSPRTVGGHVTSILTKLDVNSRAAAAAFAVRHGLA